MKKTFTLLLAFLISFLPACAAGNGEVASTEKQGAGNMKIQIDITNDNGNHTLTATLAPNSSATAFYELLKKGAVTIKMNEYGDFEKVGSLGTSLPSNDRQVKTSAGDIMLYQGNQITIFYNGNSWSYTPLGKVDGVTQAELKKILGKGNVTAVFSVME